MFTSATPIEPRKMRFTLAALLTVVAVMSTASPGYCINGGALLVTPRNGWRAFEVITQGNDPTGDGFTWAMPGTYDGLGAWLPNANTLRVLVNHETGDATVSAVDLNLGNFKTAIRNRITSGNTGGVSFVTSARQAYGRWSDNGGSSWITTTDISNTTFYRFCSSQSHVPNAFGAGRGFVDNLYITGEEGSTNRLFALDLANRDFYRLSGVTGSASGGIGGMPFDSWENAALLDTGETNHVALLLSPDGGTQRLMLYVGVKGKNTAGADATDFLARNGLAYGSYYYLNDTLPASGTSGDGFFDITTAGALTAAKLEDVDANPNDPTQAVLGVQETGLFTFDFNLNFTSSGLNTTTSSFSVTKIQNHVNDTGGQFGDADNVDWTAATTLNGVNYPNGLVVVNEDSGAGNTGDGETWMMRPDGSGLTLIADTIGILAATETSGILDISNLVGYKPGSVLLTTNQGSTASMTALIHPQAALAGDFDGDGDVDAADYVVWRMGLNVPITPDDYGTWRSQFGEEIVGGGAGQGGASVPEPMSLMLAVMLAAWGMATVRRTRSS